MDTSLRPPKKLSQLWIVLPGVLLVALFLLCSCGREEPRSQENSPPVAARPGPGPGLRESVPTPQFPWPPPSASAREVLPRTLFHGSHLVDIDRTLSNALHKNGYAETSYYAVPSGFALVTRLEQIDIDGRSKSPPGRWSVDALARMSSFSLKGYINALFIADPGRYRVIVFVVTDVPFRESDTQISKEEALGWLRDGWNVLPSIIGERPFTADVNCTALIYEFEKKGNSTRILLPSGLGAHAHLIQSGILGAFQGG